MMKLGKKNILYIGMTVSLFLLYFSLRDVDWSALKSTLVEIKIFPIIVCFFMISFGIILRGWRWSLISGTSSNKIIFFIRSTNFGVLANQLLPVRLGEIVRILILKKQINISLSELLSSALIDRMLDVLSLLVSTFLVSSIVVNNILPKRWLLGAGILISIIMAAVIIFRAGVFQFWLNRLSERWFHRWSLRPELFVLSFNRRIEALCSFMPAILVILAVILVWFSDYLAVMSAIWSVDLELPLIAPLFLWVMLAASSTLPSAPAYIGVYQFASVLTLKIFNVPSHKAIAVSFILQVITLAVSLAGAGKQFSKILIKY